jgi:YhcN/YlaJ family sporulation lipoprotein
MQYEIVNRHNHFINYKFVKTFCQSLEGSSQIVLKRLYDNTFTSHGYFQDEPKLCIRGNIYSTHKRQQTTHPIYCRNPLKEVGLMSIKKWHLLILSISILAIAILSGCSEGGRQYGKSPDHTNFGSPVEDNTGSERAYQTQQQYGPVTHNNAKLDYSEFLSNQVMTLNGVNTAIVMVTDQNAYVGILIDSTATGTKGRTRETNNDGTRVGIYNPDNPNSDSINSNDLNNGANNYETAQDHSLLSHRFKQRIAERIRFLNPAIMDVYISANRDFVNAMNNYAQESWKGHSLQTYLSEFNTTVTHFFGTNQILPNK